MKLPKLPTVAKINEVLADAKKALGALGVMTTAAVGFGLLDSATAGLVLGGIGVLTTGVVWVLDNDSKPAVPPAPTV